MAVNSFNWKKILDQETSSSKLGSLKLKKVDVQFVDGRVIAPREIMSNGLKCW